MRRPGKKTLLFGCIVAPLVVAGAGQVTLGRMDANGKRFYETGKAAVERLGELAGAVSREDWQALEALYAPDFTGTRIVLAAPRPVGAKDGVETFRFLPAKVESDRAIALDDWRTYREGFAAIEEIGLHLHRVESWEPGGEVLAQVRFELIGRLAGRPRPSIDRALLRMRLVAVPEDGGGLMVREASLLEGERLVADVAHFTEVGKAAGIDFANRYYPPFLTEPLRFGMIRYGPGGISAVDFDNDGWYDLFVPDGVFSRLFRNQRDGTFADVTEASGLAGLDGASVGVFADYDNDGWKDLFVSRTFTPNRLFHNLGPDASGRIRFADVTAGSGLGEDCCTTVASWGDVDKDGLLDLYVGRYLDPRKDIPTTFYARNGLPNRLYRNLGGGKFEDVTEGAGVGEVGLCLGTVFGDYDDDGDADLYVANDFGRNTLYRNDGDGTFTDVSVATGTLAYGAGMSASFGDADNDGRLDLYVANIRSEHGWFAERPTVMRYMANSFRQGTWLSDMPLYLEIYRQSGNRFVAVFQQMASGNNLLRNRGDGTFDDVTWQAGANPLGWFWGSSFADFDNDGWQDVYSANGWVYNDRGTEIELEFLNNVVGDQRAYKSGRLFDPEHFGRKSWHGWERNRHLRNRGDGTFQEVATPAGTDLLRNSRGIAVADFWNRGVLDVAVAASADRHALLRNEVGTRRHWLEIELVGTRSNRDAVGARVVAKAQGKMLTREVVAGDGYASQNMLRLHFGLGDAPVVEELTVKWPSGTVQRFTNVASGRIVTITEGKGLTVRR